MFERWHESPFDTQKSGNNHHNACNDHNHSLVHPAYLFYPCGPASYSRLRRRHSRNPKHKYQDGKSKNRNPLILSVARYNGGGPTDAAAQGQPEECQFIQNMFSSPPFQYVAG